MALSKLDNLYRQVILDHSSHPHHYGMLDASSQTIELNNPTCGDVIELDVAIEDGVIKDIVFQGSGCSISTASASMMTDAVLGKTTAEVTALAEDFSQLVQGNEVAEDEKLGDAAMLSGVAKFLARIKCATLVWKALEQVVANNGQGEAGHLHREK